MTDIPTIAASLSEAQRRALRRGLSMGPGYWPLANALRSKALISDRWGSLTTLGRQVRDYLEGKSS